MAYYMQIMIIASRDFYLIERKKRNLQCGVDFYKIKFLSFFNFK